MQAAREITSSTTIPSLEAAKNYIYSMDLSMIQEKMVSQYKWLKIETAEVCQQYRNFLYLIKKYQKHRIIPSQKIDEIWHQHILNTSKYHLDCENIFGYYLHHQPSSQNDSKSTPTLKSDFEKTKRLYYNQFGIELTDTKYYLKPLLRHFHF